MIVKEFWHLNTSESEIREHDFQSKEDIIIKSLYSLVSTGTEKIISLGMVPPEIHSSMRVPYMDGNFNMPVKYGYSLVGEVVSGGKEFLGKTVHLMHPHQDIAFVSEQDIMIVPDNIPAKRAVLTSNMETALNGLWDSKISPGDNVLICGFGSIGALTAILMKQIPAVNVFIHEISESRKQIAKSFGFHIFDKEAAFNQFDVAINASGSEDALQICINNTLPGGLVNEMSWYGDRVISLKLGSYFHTGQKIISSQVSNIPLDKLARYNLKRRKKVVFELLKNDIFDKLPFSFVEFDELPKVFHKIRNQTYNDFCTIVKYQ